MVMCCRNSNVIHVSSGGESGYKQGTEEPSEDGTPASSRRGTDVSGASGIVLDSPPPSEPWYSTLLQVSAPFFLAGVGTIGAGVILGKVQDSVVFSHVNALLILVSSLLGLKGNLDMCLASRLSTLANTGEMKSKKQIFKMVYGNLALVQVQAIVAAICVAIFAVSVTAIMDKKFELSHALVLSASSITTATSSCFFLDLVMIGVIILAHRYKVNPDNLATPLAASIGDVISITLLYTFSTAFYTIHDEHAWVVYTVIGCYLLILPLWVWLAYKNEFTRPVLTSGWVPVLSALIISGLGGLVMKLIVKHYKNFAVFQPIINGIGGNLVSVQASRISTMLHQSSIPGIIPPYTRLWTSPWSALVYGLPHASTSRILFGLSIVGQTAFVLIADVVNSGYLTIGFEFVLCYLAASSLQVLLLLYLAHFFIHFMWRLKVDPDNSAIPFLTSIGDLCGSSLLAAAFVFLDLVLHSDSIQYVEDSESELRFMFLC